MTNSERIWQFLATHPDADAHAVAAAVGMEPIKAQRTLNKAVSRGHVSSEGKAGRRRYTLLTAPKSYARTPEEKKARRREWAKGYRAKQPRKRKPFTVVVSKRKPTAKREPVNVAADVAAFLANGGKIERLPRNAVSRPFKRITGGRVPNPGPMLPELGVAA